MKKIRVVGIIVVLALLKSVFAQIDVSKLKELQAGNFPQNLDISQLAEMVTGNSVDVELPSTSSSVYNPSVIISGLDNSVDENTYILGAGDKITAYIWGVGGEVILMNVTPEGKVIIPTVNKEISVGGLSLAEGKSKIREVLSKTYKKNSMSLVLTGIRKSGARIMGDVVKPGVYVVNGSLRVSDLINLAGGFSKINDVRSRGIEISNDHFPTIYADMARYYHSDDIDANPYIREGDRVFVSRRKKIISVFGEVNYSGTYDYVDGDNLATVISAAGGVTRKADTSRIMITRFLNDLDSLKNFIVPISSADTFAIQCDDRIMVCRIPDYRVHRKVIISGEVAHPGVYPIQKQKTRILDVIKMAGGLTEASFLKGSSLIRRKYKQDDEKDVLRLIRTPIAGMSPKERSYLKTRLTETNGMSSINFENLFNGKNKDSYNVILRDGDSIYIAKKKLTVRVMGAVVSPGLISYLGSSAKYRDYINKTGGLNSLARKHSIVIIKGGTNTWLSPRKAGKIEPGDTIFVPEREYINKIKATKDILSILGSIASVILTTVTVTSILSDK